MTIVGPRAAFAVLLALARQRHSQEIGDTELIDNPQELRVVELWLNAIWKRWSAAQKKAKKAGDKAAATASL
jgi:hypothetical protein